MQSNNPKSLSQLNQEFNFNWNDPFTFLENKPRAQEVDAAIQKMMATPEVIKPEESIILGHLCYKLGTFYAHVAKEPANALEKVKIAQRLLLVDPEKTEIK